MLRSLSCSRRMWPLTRVSPSMPIQMTDTCGLPSALIVLRWASGPGSMSARSSGERLGIATPIFSDGSVGAQCRRALALLAHEHERHRQCAAAQRAAGGRIELEPDGDRSTRSDDHVALREGGPAAPEDEPVAAR